MSKEIELLRRELAGARLEVTQLNMKVALAKHESGRILTATREEVRQALRELREVQESGDVGEETGAAINLVEHRLLKLLPPGEPWPIPPQASPSPATPEGRPLREEEKR